MSRLKQTKTIQPNIDKGAAMNKYLDVVTFLSSAAVMSRKAETYSPDTQVIDLAELRQIIFELQQDGGQEAE